MKLLLVLLVLLPIVFEIAAAARVPVGSSVDYYGRYNRNSRMSEKSKIKVQKVEEDDDEDADDEDDADDDADDDDSFYPPDFEKLFPNPDGKPTGPDANAYNLNHPTNVQHGKPTHGPGSLSGPAALRGPVPQHSPRPNGGYNSRPPPQRDGPARGHSSRPPPPQYSSRPHYRTELVGYVKEPVNSKVSSLGRQYKPLVHGGSGYIISNPRQVPVIYRPGTNLGYQNRRVISYPALAQYGGSGYYVSNNYQVPYYGGNRYYPGNRYPGNRYPGNRYPGGGHRYPGGYYPGNRYPGNRYPGNRRPGGYYPYSVPTQVLRARDDSSEDDVQVQDVSQEVPETKSSRVLIYPWYRDPARGDAYNPEYVVDPTAMRSRRRFVYHPSQIVPSQRIPIYSGYWGNPRPSHH